MDRSRWSVFWSHASTVSRAACWLLVFDCWCTSALLVWASCRSQRSRGFQLCLCWSYALDILLCVWSKPNQASSGALSFDETRFSRSCQCIERYILRTSSCKLPVTFPSLFWCRLWRGTFCLLSLELGKRRWTQLAGNFLRRFPLGAERSLHTSCLHMEVLKSAWEFFRLMLLCTFEC